MADLTFIDDGNRDRVGGNLINFSKRRLDYSVICNIQMYQASEYNLADYEDLRNFLTHMIDDDAEQLDVLEKQLYERSLEVEPRGADRANIL